MEDQPKPSLTKTRIALSFEVALPRPADAHGLFVNSLLSAVGPRVDATRFYGLPTDDLQVEVPVDLYAAAEMTQFKCDYAKSVLDVLRECVRSLKWVPRYPCSDDAMRTIDHFRRANRNLNEALERWQDSACDERLRAAAAEGWLQSLSNEMGSALADFGLPDQRPSDGDQQPNASTRLGTILGELRRRRGRVPSFTVDEVVDLVSEYIHAEEGPAPPSPSPARCATPSRCGRSARRSWSASTCASGPSATRYSCSPTTRTSTRRCSRASTGRRTAASRGSS